MKTRPRCGQPLHGKPDIACVRPAGHSGGHASGLVSDHGYISYSRGCRCDTCTEAKAAYMRDRRTEAACAARSGWAVDGVTHGTRSAYEEAGCRCGQCLAGERRSSRFNRPRRRTGEAA